MTYINPTCQKQANILDYMVIILNDANFTLIERLNNTKLLRFRLKKREDFWIYKLKTLKPHGFNAQVNFSNH